VHGNQLTFSRSGDRRRLYGVSPLLYPQYHELNHYFLPDGRELPAHGLPAQVLVFDFGFALPNQTIGPMDSQFFPVTVGSNFLALAATGVSDVPPTQNVTVPAMGSLIGVQVDPAYLITIQQTHGGNTWQWMNKGVTNREFCGTAYNPMMLKSPVLIPAGDTVSCTVQNMANTSLRVQIILVGGSF
jgi:hypothetical protein